ncbi:MAG: hypothetical protein WAK40_02520 [Thermoplasmata archaeon]
MAWLGYIQSTNLELRRPFGRPSVTPEREELDDRPRLEGALPPDAIAGGGTQIRSMHSGAVAAHAGHCSKGWKDHHPALGKEYVETSTA